MATSGQVGKRPLAARGTLARARRPTRRGNHVLPPVLVAGAYARQPDAAAPLKSSASTSLSRCNDAQQRGARGVVWARCFSLRWWRPPAAGSHEQASRPLAIHQRCWFWSTDGARGLLRVAGPRILIHAIGQRHLCQGGFRDQQVGDRSDKPHRGQADGAAAAGPGVLRGARQGRVVARAACSAQAFAGAARREDHQRVRQGEAGPAAARAAHAVLEPAAVDRRLPRLPVRRGRDVHRARVHGRRLARRRAADRPRHGEWRALGARARQADAPRPRGPQPPPPRAPPGPPRHEAGQHTSQRTRR